MVDLATRFKSVMDNIEDKEYMFNILIYNIVPVICGYKCASLITFSNKNKNMNKLWKTHKDEFLRNINLKYYELVQTEEIYTVLFYAENKLRNIIEDSDVRDFLKELGYKNNFTLLKYLDKLRNRFDEGCPHEMGIFLGIPLEDVKGFINNDGKKYLYCGYWKVYSHIKKALITFENYNKAKEMVLALMLQEKRSYDILKCLYSSIDIHLQKSI